MPLCNSSNSNSSSSSRSSKRHSTASTCCSPWRTNYQQPSTAVNRNVPGWFARQLNTIPSCRWDRHARGTSAGIGQPNPQCIVTTHKPLLIAPGSTQLPAPSTTQHAPPPPLPISPACTACLHCTPGSAARCQRDCCPPRPGTWSSCVCSCCCSSHRCCWRQWASPPRGRRPAAAPAPHPGCLPPPRIVITGQRPVIIPAAPAVRHSHSHMYTPSGAPHTITGASTHRVRSCATTSAAAAETMATHRGRPLAAGIVRRSQGPQVTPPPG